MSEINQAVFNKIREKVIAKLVVTGELVESSAKSLCRVVTGNLMNSISYKVDEDNLSVAIGTNVEYAPFIEFGTGEHAENGKGRKEGWYFKDDKGNWHFTKGGKPQPFLRPAVLENKNKIEEIFSK